MDLIYFEFLTVHILKPVSMGPAFVFIIDRSSIFTGYFNKGFLHWDFYLEFSLCRMLVYSGFRVDKSDCILYIYTVKPMLRGHLWDKEKVVF